MGVAGVIAEELRRLLSSPCALHALPERNGLVRVVVRSRHVGRGA
jgi:hypothetical protein